MRLFKNGAKLTIYLLLLRNIIEKYLLACVICSNKNEKNG